MGGRLAHKGPKKTLPRLPLSPNRTAPKSNPRKYLFEILHDPVAQ